MPTCPSCWSGVEDDVAVCPTCSATVRPFEKADIPVSVPLSPNATRSLVFAVIPFGVNIVTLLIVGGRALLAIPSASAVSLELGAGVFLFLVITRLIVVALVVFSIIYAVRAFADTRDHRMRGRGRVIWALVFCALTIYEVGTAAYALGSAVLSAVFTP